jgi:NADH:ubiquinone oxidoreductase subunit E
MAREMSETELDTLIEKVIKSSCSFIRSRKVLIPLLQEIQNGFGYIPKRVFKKISVSLKIPVSHIYGVATFYHQFRLRPEGKHIITVCKGTACHVGDAAINYDFIYRYLKLDPADDTSEDGLFTVLEVRCVGACSLAPIIKIDDDVYGKVTPLTITRILSKYRSE